MEKLLEILNSVRPDVDFETEDALIDDEILSSSIRSSAPIPERTSASAVYPPTPPTPKMATRDDESFFIASSPKTSWILEN